MRVEEPQHLGPAGRHIDHSRVVRYVVKKDTRLQNAPAHVNTVGWLDTSTRTVQSVHQRTEDHQIGPKAEEGLGISQQGLTLQGHQVLIQQVRRPNLPTRIGEMQKTRRPPQRMRPLRVKMKKRMLKN